MKNFEEKLFGAKLVPVVVLENAKNAVPLAKTLYNCGIETIEITLRTDAALDAIKEVAKEVPDMLVGAGTVMNVEMAKEAMNAGAKYIVMAGLQAEVVNLCTGENIPVYPGVTTPTEIIAAMDLGLKDLKFFPAEQSGGVRKLKAFASPFGNITFMPTGGVTKENINDYLKLPNVNACGGSWICPKDLIAKGDYKAIEKLCVEALEVIKGSN